jgi:hypothetical protein
MQVDSDTLAYSLGLIAAAHGKLAQKGVHIKQDDGSSIPYPACSSFMAVLEASGTKMFNFHLLLKDPKIKGMCKQFVVDDFESVAMWSIFSDDACSDPCDTCKAKGHAHAQRKEHCLMHLQTACTFSDDGAIEVLVQSGLDAIEVLKNHISLHQQRNGRYVQVNAGTRLDLTKRDFSHSSCGGCGAEFSEDSKPKHCMRCNLNVLYCNRECQLTHWPQHKQMCKQGAMMFMREFVSVGGISYMHQPAHAPNQHVCIPAHIPAV